MSDQVIISLIVAISAALTGIGSALMLVISSYVARREKRADAEIAAERLREEHRRQDAVAERLFNQQAEQARLLKENNRVAVEQAEATNREIKILTGMLDGNFTKLMEDNLVALSNGLLLSRQLLAMTFAAGHEPDPDSLAEIKATEARIGELKKAIAQRKQIDAVIAARETP